MANRTGKISVEPKSKFDQRVSDAAAKSGGTPATKTTAGIVKQAALVANAAGANPTQAEYNALLTALKTAGLMAST